MIGRATPREIVPDPGARSALDDLVRTRGVDRFAYFHVTGEGEIFPSGMEAASGKVLAGDGRVYRFWTAWDAGRDELTFAVWERAEPEAGWERSVAYKRARAALELP